MYYRMQDLPVIVKQIQTGAIGTTFRLADYYPVEQAVWGPSHSDYSRCVYSMLSAIKENKSIETLSLYHKNASDSSEVFGYIIIFLEDNLLLKELDLKDVKIKAQASDQVLQVLAQHTSLKRLNLSNFSLPYNPLEKIVKILVNNPALESLHLNGNKIFSKPNVFMAALKSNRSLTTLELSEVDLSAEHLQELANILAEKNQLQSFNISWNNIGDKGVTSIATALQQHTSLHTLHLGGNKISAQGAQSIATMLSALQLEKLYLGFNQMGASGIKAITDNMGTIKELDLSGHMNAESQAVLADALKNNHCLEMIDLSYNSALDLAQLKLSLAENKTLKTLKLRRNWALLESKNAQVDAILDIINTNTRISEFDLSDNGMDDEQVEKILQSLKQRSTTTQITLWLNKMSCETGLQLTQLQVLAKIRELSAQAMPTEKIPLQLRAIVNATWEAIESIFESQDVKFKNSLYPYELTGLHKDTLTPDFAREFLLRLITKIISIPYQIPTIESHLAYMQRLTEHLYRLDVCIHIISALDEKLCSNETIVLLTQICDEKLHVCRMINEMFVNENKSATTYSTTELSAYENYKEKWKQQGLSGKNVDIVRCSAAMNKTLSVMHINTLKNYHF